MRLPILASLAALLLPQAALSQSLCLKGEIDYFSCQTAKNNKIISVCGNIVDGNVIDGSWLQYRFGKKEAVELAFPKERKGSISKFEGNYFNKYNVVDLRFINGNALYGVSLNGAYSGEDAQEPTNASGGVTVHLGKYSRTNIQCKNVDIDKYFQTFSELNGELSRHNGKKDLLYHFLNNVAKYPQLKSASLPGSAEDSTGGSILTMPTVSTEYRKTQDCAAQ